MKIKMLFLTFVVLTLAACSTSEHKALAKQDALYKGCKDPRPQICTREYRPVCGTRDKGGSPQEHKTYGNACTACSDATVIEYRTGECNAAKPASK